MKRRHERIGLVAGLVSVLLLAVAAHALTVWAVPRVIMHRAMALVGGDAPPAPVLPPMTDHHQRRIVMPSPDLLYATCAWDLGERPLRVRAELAGAGYASIALYAANSDNFFTINDRQASGGPVDLLLVHTPAGGTHLAPPAGARIVQSPSRKGLLLMRVLVADRAIDEPAAHAIRQTLRCEPA